MATAVKLSQINVIARSSSLQQGVRRLPYNRINTSFIEAQIVVTYYMRGFDSATLTPVYWQSVGSPTTAPGITTPALIGTLLYPHKLEIY